MYINCSPLLFSSMEYHVKYIKFAVLTGSAVLLATSAVAADSKAERKQEDSIVYSGASFSRVSTGFDNLDDATNLNFTLLGLRVPNVSWFAIEANLGFTLQPGENSGSVGGGGGLIGGGGGGGGGNNTASSEDLRINTTGLFAIFRTPGKFYAGAKYGFSKVTSNIEEVEDAASGTARGFTAGYRFNPEGFGQVELEFLDLGDQLDSIGLAFSYIY
ncbi:MAG: hypothetical protein ACI9HX_001163 [Pseudoalteromonas tetraodonis]|jgi:hypothetical protein